MYMIAALTLQEKEILNNAVGAEVHGAQAPL